MQRILVPLVVILLGASAAFALQERVQKPKAKDFGAILGEAKTAYDAKRFGATIGHLRDALGLASGEQRKAVLAAFPAAPTGWTFEAAEQLDESAAAVAGLALMAGTNIEGAYRDADGNEVMGVTVLADSPLSKMMGMMISNPSMLDKDSELVKYGKHSAVLRTRTKGSSYELQILIDDDLVTVDVNGATDDQIFAVWSQAAVDKLAAALAN